MRHCAHKVSLNCCSKDWESLSTAKQKEWKGERRKKVWFPAWVWCVCMHVCEGESEGGGQEAHLYAFPLITGSAWQLPLHNGFASASRLQCIFFPWGVPLEDRDREDECPFVTICPWTVVSATHAPQNLPAHAPCIYMNHYHDKVSQ